jgi:prepilin-type N-terminal cleavage/methylation domain-containing protein
MTQTPQRAQPARIRLRRARSVRGFSLLELLVAMSIFSVISVGIITLLARVSEFTQSGSSKTETLDALQTFTQSFARDISGIHAMAESDTGAPAVRLYSDVANCDVDGNGKPDAPVRRLMFTKLISEESSAPGTRSAGSSLDAKSYTDQKDDSAEAQKGTLRATGGLMEVFWTALPDDPADPAVCTLYRAYRSPIGGPQSLMPDAPAPANGGGSAADRGPLTLAEVKPVATAVLPGVLHFGVEFWGRKTQTWDPMRAPPEGPLLTWDSTRGIMPRGNLRAGATDGFFYAKDRNAPGSTGEDSLQDPTDDTFPRRLRVTLVVEEIGENRKVGNLAADLSADAKVLELYGTGFIPAVDTTQKFVKIGSEWIQFDEIDGGSRLTGLRRGQRGTVAQRHETGRMVHYGRTVVREFPVPTFRDAYKDELPAITERR